MAHFESLEPRIGRRALLAAALGLTLAGPASAGGGRAFEEADPVSLSVIDRASGQGMPIWRRAGRSYIAGQPGARYALRVVNHSDRRVLVVMSVDGINIISGQTAGYGQRGYVLDPHQIYDVTGWRKSDEEVAGFSFAPLPQSYAARTGRPGEVGVIGLAVFKERLPIEPLDAEGWTAPPPPVARRATPLATPSAPLAVPAPPPPPPPSTREVTVTGSRVARQDFGSQAPDEKLGTAHGARERSQVYTVNFERSTPYPVATLQIEYDTYANLVSHGVIPGGRSEEPPPRAFPAPPHGGGYVPDPPDNR
jgi:hypothetical protein